MRLGSSISLVLVLGSFAAPLLAEDSGHFNFALGRKSIDDAAWNAVDDQDEIGVRITWEFERWPVGLATDVSYSREESDVPRPLMPGQTVEIKGETIEIDLGVRKVFGQGRVHPFVGGGAAFINGFFDAFGADDSDIGIGGWINAGVTWRVTGRFTLGFELRASRANVELFNLDAEAGGDHGAVLAGFSW